MRHPLNQERRTFATRDRHAHCSDERTSLFPRQRAASPRLEVAGASAHRGRHDGSAKAFVVSALDIQERRRHRRPKASRGKDRQECSPEPKDELAIDAKKKKKASHTQHARLQKIKVSIVALTALASELEQRVETVDDGKEFNAPSFFRPRRSNSAKAEKTRTVARRQFFHDGFASWVAIVNRMGRLIVLSQRTTKRSRYTDKPIHAEPNCFAMHLRKLQKCRSETSAKHPATACIHCEPRSTEKRKHDEICDDHLSTAQ